MNKNPVYGNTIIDIRDNVIKNNPEIQNLINKSRAKSQVATLQTGGNLFRTNQPMYADSVRR